MVTSMEGIVIDVNPFGSTHFAYWRRIATWILAVHSLRAKYLKG